MIPHGRSAKRMLLPLTTLLIVCALAARGGVGSTWKAEHSADFSLSVFPEDAEPGAVLVVTIKGPNLIPEGFSAEGSLGDQELIFRDTGEGKGLISLAGIDLEEKPGEIPLTVRIRTGEGAAEIIRRSVAVIGKEFPIQRLTIEEKPYTPEVLERIERERERLRSLWKIMTPDRIWRGRFLEPLQALEVTSAFGLRRFINETPRQAHMGIDLRAATGDTVFASNGGRVVLTGDFYFSGQSVILDHGEGLYSMYFHLSRTLAEEGDEVLRGAPIGLAGSTGRATAPHLHWGIILRGAHVDPLKILGLPL